MKPKPRSEREITQDIVAWMEYHGYRPNRIPAGPMFSRRGNQSVPQHTNPTGYPDWLFTKAGELPWYAEIKAPGEKPTPLQVAWLERLRKDGFDADWYDGFRAPEGKKPFLIGGTT